ncbi:dynamin family protein [Leptolyngbya sp. Heron Island J]|uniref:dynamin family protein n=1 Tax=Leptolyngbya sp. Heron Island J TaxID=1385935 RepID=UPI0004079AE2|nr:dynamin family protein [Leptolyngbya sp. Heron Island J]
MSTIQSTDFFSDLDRVAKVRHQMADVLSGLTKVLADTEAESADTSGELGLEQTIEDMHTASQNLRRGVFRLLVLGDMKRGKSTFLNALIGENLLPSDVNPCTALLTVLRYGPEKKVTVHFVDGRAAEALDFAEFKQRYTIDPAEAKQLETNQELAFPDVSHAVVEYPLPLLEKGVEIVDSPGLNDTEARNELSLGYINNCHAILFVLRATQPCTLAERRYLENYIKGRGLAVFFLINAWDQVKESLLDPDDTEEVAAAEARLHQVFRTQLEDYCQIDGQDWYDERVFAISARNALRQRLKNPDTTLDGTGFPPFIEALNQFLTQERAVAEFRQARTLGRQAQNRFAEVLERRLPLLNQTVDELKQRIESVEPEFKQLADIRDQFRADIRSMCDRKSHAVANSFRTYVLNLENTFEADFLRYQPEIRLREFISDSGRGRFNAQLKQAFEQYFNDKFYAWSRTAEQEVDAAFAQLAQNAAQYGASYAQITDRMTAKLTGQNTVGLPNSLRDDSSPSWATWAMGLISLASGNIAGMALAATGFDWQSILLNFLTVSSIALVASALFGVVLGPLTVALVGLGFGALQLDQARKELAKAMKKELVKHLPKLADEQWQPIYDAVHDGFDSYEKTVIERIDQDIASRKAELDNLVKQKETCEINRDTETQRLKSAQADVNSACQQLESVYQYLLAVD